MKMNPIQRNAYHALKHLLNAAHIRYTDLYLQQQLFAHPNFPDLKAISDTLQQYRMETLALNLTPELLTQIPMPAIIHRMDGTYGVINDINTDKVRVYNDAKGWESIDYYSFVNSWDGVALVINTNEKSGERNYTQNSIKQWKKKLFTPLLLCLLSLLLLSSGYVFLNTFTIEHTSSFFLLLAIKLIGLGVFFSLFSKELNNFNPYRQSTVGPYTEVKADGLQPTGYFSLVEIGLFYLVLATALLLFQPASIPLHWTLTLLALFFIYTLKKLKLIFGRNKTFRNFFLLAIFDLVVSFIDFINYGIEQSLNPILITIIILVIACLWLIIVPLIKNQAALQAIHSKLERMKFEKEYLAAQKLKHTFFPPLFEGMHCVEHHHPDHNHQLTVVLNPMCANSKSFYQELIPEYALHEKANVRFIFAINSTNELAKRWLHALIQQSTDQRAEYLDLWFSKTKPDVDLWLSHLSLTTESMEDDQQCLMHEKWIQLANIAELPFVLINGVALSPYYRIGDIDKIISTSEATI